MSLRILVAGDTGANLNHWRLVYQEATTHYCSSIYQLGDTGYSERDVIGQAYADELSYLSNKHNVTMAFIDGNHDNHRQLQTYQNAKHSKEGFWQIRKGVFYIPRGHAWEVENVRFLGLGGAYSVDKAERLRIEREHNRPGSMWSPDEELTNADVSRAKRRGKVDIMLTHDKPRASNPGGGFTSVSACWANQDKVSEVMQAVAPKLLLHGHLHFPYEDHVRVGERGDWCRIISLESDEIGSRNRPYDPRNSWLVLELNKGKFDCIVIPPALTAM